MPIRMRDGGGLRPPLVCVSTLKAAERPRSIHPWVAQMCNPGMTLKEPTGKVYNRLLRLQQLLRKPQRRAEAKGGVLHERACADVSKIGATVVDGCDHAHDVSLFRLREQLAKVFNDGAILLRSYELQDVFVTRQIFAYQLLAPPCWN